MGSQSTYMTIENDSMKINRNVVFGLSAIICYDIRIYNDWYLSPQYKFYLGLTPEFKETEESIHSLRHYFEIGVKRKIK